MSRLDTFVPCHLPTCGPLFGTRYYPVAGQAGAAGDGVTAAHPADVGLARTCCANRSGWLYWAKGSCARARHAATRGARHAAFSDGAAPRWGCLYVPLPVAYCSFSSALFLAAVLRGEVPSTRQRDH